MDAPPIQYARTADGVNIAYFAIGSGPTLIQSPWLVGSIAQEWEIPPIRAWYERLAQHYRLVCYDHRGQGASSQAAPPPSGFADPSDLTAIVDAVANEPAFILAMPSSGTAARRYVAEHPDRCAGLVLFNTRGGRIGTSALTSTIINAVGAEHAPEVADVLAFRSLGWVDAAVGTAYSRVVQAAYEAGSLQEWLDFMDAAPPDLDHGTTPTLIVYGDSSGPGAAHFSRAQAQAAAARAGHLVRLDDVAELPWHSATSQDSALNAILRFTDPLSSVADPPAVPAPGFRTLLFTDLESSTALTQTLGDDKAQEVLDGHDAAVRTALAAHGGEEVKHTGDGIMAAFSSAVAAVEAALQIQRELAGSEVRVRVGLNAGEPIAKDDDYFGSAVQLAARVCDRAEPGQLLVSQVVRDLCRGKAFTFEDQGEATLKGFPEPVRLFVVEEGA